EKETAILKYLYRAGEKVITRDVLLHEVWGYNSGVTTHTLETHIYRLRQKIDSDIALLRRVPLFADLPTEQIRLLAFSAIRLDLEPDQVLFREGSRANSG